MKRTRDRKEKTERGTIKIKDGMKDGAGGGAEGGEG